MHQKAAFTEFKPLCHIKNLLLVNDMYVDIVYCSLLVLAFHLFVLTVKVMR